MNPPKMPIHIGDYKRDTGHLRAAGHGAYLLLMFHYWSTGGLPDDDEQLSAIACMSRGEWKRMRPIIEPFFRNKWKHKRIDYDLEQASKISKAAREAGKASGRSRSVGKPLPVSLNGRSSAVQPTLEPSFLEERKEDTATAVSSATSYAFESGVIRLNQQHFDQWQQSFSHLDLRAELLALTEWAGQQPPGKWFFAVASALAKRNREVHANIERSKGNGLTNDEAYWGKGRTPGIL